MMNTDTPTALDAMSSHATANTSASTAALTPQRGRPSDRYPDSLRRVPLHRRGTSKTYERLEDLLREAGYKETRVFTPEIDRNARSAAVKEDGSAGNTVRGSVGAVVDFIAGLVSRGSSLSREAAPSEDSVAQPAWSPPPSPLSHAAYLKDISAKRVPSMISLSRKDSSGSIRRRTHVERSVDASRHTHTYQVVQLHQSSQGLPHHSHPHLSPHHYHHHTRQQRQPNYSSKSSSTKPNPTNARAYLRHMVSAPNIQPLAEQPLSEASSRPPAFGRERRNKARRMFILNDEDGIAKSDYEPRSRVAIDDDDQQVPPLPRNWLESVAKALLSGVGAPAAVTSDTASTKTAKTASTRKSLALSDKSNREERGRPMTRGTKPPLLCAQVQDAKARTSSGQVSCTRVMCRSTPTSRANSRVRRGAHDGHVINRNDGKRREMHQTRSSRRGTVRETDILPSLARTKVENDNWMAPRQRYARGWGTEGSAQVYPDEMWSDDSGDDDDEDEEGELGLDRLLVPPRRQHSIQSLRKHLHRSPSRLLSVRGVPRPKSPLSGRTSPLGGAPTRRLNWGDGTWIASRGQESLTSQGHEGEDGYSYVFSGSEAGSGRSSVRLRRALPGLAQWTATS